VEGKIVHMELPAKDTGRATKFWGSLCGWTFQHYDGPIEYHMFEGDPGGGIYPQQMGETGPIVYFGTEDLEAEMGRVRELGGEAGEKSPVPAMGWYSQCKDTEGNAFAIWQSDESAPAREG